MYGSYMFSVRRNDERTLSLRMVRWRHTETNDDHDGDFEDDNNKKYSEQSESIQWLK